MTASRWPRYTVPAVLIAGWTLALFLPVATTDHVNEDQTFAGWMVLFLGTFLGWMTFQFAAYANPVFLFALIYGAWRGEAARRRTLQISAVLLALAVVSALAWRNIPDDSGMNSIVAFHSGYYLWLGVMVCAAGWLWFSASRKAAD
ncbi:hypothetical protein [Citromicrobium bathyomarinum]|uniref:hypothetical protein n=1 Tax=Citromicrobium bathyomarinum TaxID=72174 RepID=UPI003159A5AB